MSLQGETERGFFGCLFDCTSLELTLNVASAYENGACAEWFTVPECRAMWAAVDAFWTSPERRASTTDEKPGVATIISEARAIAESDPKAYEGADFDGFLAKAQALNESGGDLAAFSKRLNDSYMRRKIESLVRDSEKDMTKGADGVAHIGSRLAAEIQEVVNGGVKGGELRLKDITTAVISGFERSYEEYVVKKNYDYVEGLPLPWKPVSRKINGIPKGGVTIIAARPSVGKSSIALEIMMFLAKKGYKVAFDCLDMSAKQILQRPFSSLSQIPLSELKGGSAHFGEYKERLYAAKAELDKMEDDGTYTVLHKADIDDLKAWCVGRRAQGKLDIVFVDYVQQLTAHGRFKDKNAELEYISRQLKDLATTYDMPVVVLSQLSRDNVKAKDGEREPTMADLRGSGALEQDAYLVMMLFFDTGTMNAWESDPPFRVCPEGDERARRSVRPVWLKIEKNQNGGAQARFPFVVRNDVFSWHLGNKSGEKGPPGSVNAPKFLSVYPDGRYADYEASLESVGSLISVAKGGDEPDAPPAHADNMPPPPSADASDYPFDEM